MMDIERVKSSDASFSEFKDRVTYNLDSDSGIIEFFIDGAPTQSWGLDDSMGAEDAYDDYLKILRMGWIYSGQSDNSELTSLRQYKAGAESQEPVWYSHTADIAPPEEEDVYLVDFKMPGLNGRENIAQAIIHFHPGHGWRSKITPSFCGNTPKDSAYAVKNMVGFVKIFGARQVPAGSCAVPEGWHEEWKKNVMRLYLCGRKHDMSIPDDQLDFMRNYLLSAIPSNSEGERS